MPQSREQELEDQLYGWLTALDAECVRDNGLARHKARTFVANCKQLVMDELRVEAGKMKIVSVDGDKVKTDTIDLRTEANEPASSFEEGMVTRHNAVITNPKKGEKK